MNPRFRIPALIGMALAALPALANTRHFGYVYETGVLAPGAKELETSTTLRAGRDEYYSALDHRLELEVGVAERLMTSFYLNWSNETVRDDSGRLVSAFTWQGISNEWKWKLMDPVADPVGLGLYAELSFGTAGMEIEPKILLDKKAGDWLLAANLITEFEYEAEAGGEMELEEIAPDIALAASYRIKPGFMAGLELRNHNAIAKSGEEDLAYRFSALYAGPVVSYSTESWWVTLSVLPQLPALSKESGGSILELDDGEKINARLLLSFHI